KYWSWGSGGYLDWHVNPYTWAHLLELLITKCALYGVGLGPAGPAPGVGVGGVLSLGSGAGDLPGAPPYPWGSDEAFRASMGDHFSQEGGLEAVHLSSSIWAMEPEYLWSPARISQRVRWIQQQSQPP
ncbi:hypothetical protein DSO57_1039022, partial [Entomophthora muscae]